MGKEKKTAETEEPELPALAAPSPRDRARAAFEAAAERAMPELADPHAGKKPRKKGDA